VPPSEYEFAGVLGLMSNNPYTMAAEPGWIMIMPKFQVRYGFAFACRGAHHHAISSHNILAPDCTAAHY
jgi:hypothetical protein